MSDEAETEEAEYVGPSTFTNREILQLIMDEIEADGDLDEEASISQILDMGALHHPGFTHMYGLMIEDDVRRMREQAEAKEAKDKGEHLILVKKD